MIQYLFTVVMVLPSWNGDFPPKLSTLAWLGNVYSWIIFVICVNHLHWSARSTFSGNGLVIWAKFKSFLDHIVNMHSGHGDPLFNKCGHGREIPARKWLTKGIYK